MPISVEVKNNHNLDISFSPSIDFSIHMYSYILIAIDIVIYFMDKTGLTLPVLDGQHAEAGELFEMVMQEQELPHEAREVFSLWMVSDLLGMNLYKFLIWKINFHDILRFCAAYLKCHKVKSFTSGVGLYKL